MEHDFGISITDDAGEAVQEEKTPVTGKAVLDALFMRAMFGKMNVMFGRKQGKYHTARAARAKARIAKRKAAR